MPALDPSRLATATLARLGQSVELGSALTVRGIVERADQSLPWTEGHPRRTAATALILLSAVDAEHVEKHASVVVSGQSYRVVDIDPPDVSGLVRIHVRPDPAG